MAGLDDTNKGFVGYISPAVEDAIRNDQGGTYVLDFMKGNSVTWLYVFMGILHSFQGYSSQKKAGADQRSGRVQVG